MRQLIRTYTITGQHEITITGYTFTKEDVRLIIDETLAITDKRASVLVSSTAKNNIVSVVSGVITLASTTAVLTVGDELTIEIDIDNVAKEATSQEILSDIGDLDEIIEAINGDDIDGIINSYIDDYAEQLEEIIGTNG